ncbi:MAG: Zn-dependent exopeptidase M28, partial [Planctomycetota bacterium]
MNSQDAGQRIINDITEIARPRLAGTPGEKETLDLLESKLNSLGIEPRREHFEFSVLPMRLGFILVPVILTAIVFAAAFLVFEHPLVGALLAFASLAFIPLASRWSRLAEKLFDLPFRLKSANIIGEIKAENAEKTIIFVAHHDSKSQTLPIGLRYIGSILSVPLSALIGLAVLVTGIILLIKSGSPPPWMARFSHVLWIISWIPLAAAAMMLLGFTRNKSEGALDNGSGCGILLELARRLSKNPPAKTNVIFLFPGAEEMGLAGAIRYTQAHAGEFDKENTLVVNIDSVGCGPKIGIIDRYGIPPVTTSRTLSRILEAEDDNAGRLYIPIGVGFDKFPFALRGFETLTLTSRTIRVLLTIHSPNDIVRHLDPESLAKAA